MTVVSRAVQLNEDLERLNVAELGLVVEEELRVLSEADERVAAVFVGSLPHGIRLGMALLRVQSCIDRGEWYEFLSEHDLIPATAQRYMRLAHYRDAIAQWIAAGGSGKMHDALNRIAGLPRYVNPQIGHVAPIVRQLRSEGLPQKDIASLLGISRSSVSVLADPSARKRKRLRERQKQAQASAAKKALARAERDAEVKKAGGLAAEAYALLRKCSIAIDKAIEEAHDVEEREVLNEARRARNRAEDKIVESLRLSRRSRKSSA